MAKKPKPLRRYLKALRRSTIAFGAVGRELFPQDEVGREILEPYRSVIKEFFPREPNVDTRLRVEGETPMHTLPQGQKCSHGHEEGSPELTPQDNPKELESLLRDLVIAEVANQTPEGPQEPLGLQCEVADLLPSWMFGGGWDDGPFTHHPGARIYLDYLVGGRVYYQGGVRQGILGWFRVGEFRKLRLLAVEDYRAALARLEGISAWAKPGTSERDEFEGLAFLIDEWERSAGPL
ncbi:hypothetical protein [Mesoterricola silvestris]|uniref:Uncharacterized protein n=1 Tax=Mesoterricola silvestris TaxID=2927979 RepID=A0AA48GMS4_9BACT|nr:hypothetical protein [Mesoterricola silvestris]BDU70860.1 hypothetical protein METEAL_00340 [Mesoterricola silvestris]